MVVVEQQNSVVISTHYPRSSSTSLKVSVDTKIVTILIISI